MSCVRFTPAVCRIAPNRTACDMFRSYSAVGRDRHSCVLVALVRLSTLAGSLRVCSFICGDPDGGRGERGWRLSVSALLRNHIGFAMFSAGSTLGLRAPNLRQRVFDSLDSLHAAAGLPWCVFAALVRFCATASALLGFPRGVRWGYAPQTAPKSQKWKRHCRLSGLSSRCGGVALVRIRAVTRVHGKTRPALIYGRAGRAV